MFTHIETLIALATTGSMTRAATHLRVTQSTVSKRLAALECEVGRPLTEAHGRGVRLTPAGHRLLTRDEPLVASLRQALQEEELQTGGRLEIGVSESILASWGPRVLAGVHRALPELELIVNAHRSPDRRLGASCSDACADRVSNGALLSKSAAPCNPSTPSCKWPATAWYPRVSPTRSASAPTNSCIFPNLPSPAPSA